MTPRVQKTNGKQWFLFSKVIKTDFHSYFTKPNSEKLLSFHKVCFCVHLFSAISVCLGFRFKIFFKQMFLKYRNYHFGKAEHFLNATIRRSQIFRK